MKKTLPIFTLLAFFMLLSAGNVSAQLYHFSESFAAGSTPDGWAVKDVSYSNSETNAANQVDATALYAAKMKTNNTDSWIQFPLVNDAESLAFWCKVKNPMYNPIVKIQSSPDATTWTDEVTTIPGLDLTDSINFQDINIPLTVSGTKYIRIYVSADGGSSGTGMLTVDDIRLEKPALTDNDSRLAGLYVGGKLIDDFHPTTTDYSVLEVTSDQDITVSAVANNENATVVVTQVANLEGSEAERTATVVVTSVDQSSTFTANIIFTASTISYFYQTGFPSSSAPDGWSAENVAYITSSSNANQTFPDQDRGVKMKVADPVASWLQMPETLGAGELIFWCKVKNSAGTLAVKLESSTDGTTWVDAVATIPGLDLTNVEDFQNITVPLNIEGAVSLRLYVYTTDGVGTSDAFYVDDVQLTKPAAKTDDATLAGLYVGDNMMKGFNYAVTAYDSIVSLAEDFTVSAEANSPNATVTVTQVSNILGSEAERTASVVVVSEDQSVTITTTIVFTQTDYWYKTGFYSNEGLEGWNRNKVFQDQTPNYGSSDNFPGEGALKFTGGHSTSGGDDLSHGHLISPYHKNVGTLTFWASAEVVFAEHELNVYAKYSDTDSTLVKSIKGTDLTVAWQEVEVVIESEDSVQIRVEGICDINDDKTSRIWMDDFLLTYYEAPLIAADDATLDGIYMGANLIEGFDPAVTTYALEVSPIQDVTLTAEAASDLATVTIDQALNATGTVEDRTATITVVSEDASVTSVTTVVFAIPGLSIEDNETPKVVFYPNPVNDVLNIQIPDNSYQRLEVFNMIGQVVLDETLRANMENINVDDLHKGIYIMSFTGEAGTYTAKFIKE